MSFDVIEMLKPLSDEAPCGVELDEFFYAPGFQALKKRLEGEPERQMGDVVVAAKEPDWREIEQSALTLWEQAKSVRLIYAMALAGLKHRGLCALVEQLELLEGLFEQYWDHAEPLLLEEGEYDPLLRINALKAFNSRLLRERLLSCILVASAQAGTYTIGDFFIAEKHEQAPKASEASSESRRKRRRRRDEEEEAPQEAEAPSMAIIKAALQACDIEQLAATVEQLETILERVDRIERYVNEKISEYSLTFSQIREVLGNVVAPVAALYRLRLPEGADVAVQTEVNKGEQGDSEQMGEAQMAEQPLQQANKQQEHGQSGQHAMQIGQVTTREQALKLIDSVTDYFQRYEPTSPVPLFLQRAKRLAGQDFISILKDLAPNGVDQVEMISGSKTSDD